MSLKVSKNLVIGGAIVVALLVGTVLLGSYANILPAGSGSQAKTCLAASGTSCPAAQAGFDAKDCPLGRTEPCCAGDVTESLCGKTCPADSTKPCCAGEAVPDCCPMLCPPDCTEPCCTGEAVPGCCPKVCPPDCTKPCCAGEAAPSGCPMAGMSTATNSGCCPKTNTATE